MLSIGIAASLVVLVAETTAPVANTPSPQKRQTSKPPQRATPSLQPFSPHAERVRPQQAGSVGSLFQALTVRGKGEFEKTAEYERRVNALPFGDFIIAAPDTAAVSYDADLETVFVRLPVDGSYGSGGREIVYTDAPRGIGSYEGQNAYGATVNVSVSEVTTWRLLIPGGEPKDLLAELKLSPSDARRLKPRLRVLLRLSIPRGTRARIDDRGSVDIPTFATPRLIRRYTHLLEVAAVQMIVIDSTTGDIVMRSPEEVAQHPGLASPEEAIAAIIIGVSKDDVLRVAGRPADFVTADAIEGEIREVWIYRSDRQTARISFSGDRVVSVDVESVN